jgi:CubicO group peptidase (beta-lactamase class C family)
MWVTMDRKTFDGIIDALDDAHGVSMNGLLVSRDGEMFRHDFTDRGFPPTGVRSISKVVVALAVGAAIADGTRLRGRPLSHSE